jgi:hypothetical protein
VVSLGSSLGIRSPQGFSVRLYCITREFVAGVLGASVLYMYYRQNVFSLDRMCSLMAFWVRLFCTCIIVTHTGSIQYQVPIASSSLLTPHPQSTPLLGPLWHQRSTCAFCAEIGRNAPKSPCPIAVQYATCCHEDTWHLLSRGHVFVAAGRMRTRIIEYVLLLSKPLAVTRTHVRGRGIIDSL